MKIGDIILPDFPLLLAPMEQVTSPPFRKLCKEEGADLMYSEFISSEGLIRDDIKSIKKLKIFNDERPIGIQIFGGNENTMELSTKIVETVNPDLIDINFGCPVKKIVSKNAGAGILKNVNNMVQITKSIIRCTNLPVTVKTRIGWDDHSINIDEVVERLQDVGVQAISIHARTRCQMYKGKADWSHIQRIKRNSRIKIPIFGNGDVNSVEKALEYKNKYGVDGIMIGRAAIGYPWIFREIKYYFKTKKKLKPVTLKQRLEIIKKHLIWLVKWKGEKIGVLEMRCHYNNYLREIQDIKAYKTKLVQANTLNDVLIIIDEIYNFKS